MKTQDGKFVLFLDLPEFAAWLDASSFSRVIRLLQCHHTYIPSYSNFHGANHFELLRAMEAAHLERGFSEIAQNLTTFPDGTVAACRSFDTIPAGIKGANKNGICVENIGNFDFGQDSMTVKQRECIINVFALLCKKFNLSPDATTNVYHHWYDLTTGMRTDGTGNTKSCPGANFFGGNSVHDAETNYIPLVRQQLTAYLGVESVVQPAALYTADVQVDALSVRSLPSTTAGILKQLARGVEVSVYEERDSWRRIDSAKSWWVDGHFLVSTPTQHNDEALYPARVTPNVLNVRSQPSMLGNISSQLSGGTNVYVYEERNGWCRINPSASLWVDGSYLGRLPLASS